MYNLIYVRNLKRFHLLNLFKYLQEFSDEPMSKDIVVNAKQLYLVLTYADKTSIFRKANERKKKTGWAEQLNRQKRKRKKQHQVGFKPMSLLCYNCCPNR